MGDWDRAIAGVLGVPLGSPQVAKVKTYWDELNADMSGMFGGAPSPAGNGPMLQYKATWGGADYNITQEHGPTAFSIADPLGYYAYSVALLGTKGHPGIDVGMPAGTKLFLPVGGTVIRAGNASYPSNKSLGAVTGELRIRTATGHEVILGHMASITVKVGDVLAAGTPVGLSGSLNGDHLHLEYRIPSNRWGGEWEAIDPRQALGGNFSGYNQGAKTGLGYTTPLTFRNLMLAGAKGEAIPQGADFSQGGGNSSWTNWLANTMRGMQTQQTQSRKLDYANIYNMSNGGVGSPAAGGGPGAADSGTWHWAGDGHNH